MPKHSIAEIIISLRKAEELAEEYRCVAEELAEESVLSKQVAANLIECFKSAIDKLDLISENPDLPTDAIYDITDLIKDMRQTMRSVISNANV